MSFRVLLATFICMLPLCALAADDYTIKPAIDDCKVGQKPPAPKTVCKTVNGADDPRAVKESSTDAYTDNEVHILKDGSMTVCTRPVPLTQQCKPSRKGQLTFCNLLQGYEDCRTAEKTPSAGSALSHQIDTINTSQAYRDELAARNIAAEVQKTLRDTEAMHSTAPLIDNFGFIEPYAKYETGAPEGSNREVYATPDRLTQLANDYDNIYATAKQYVQAAREQGLPLSSPITLPDHGFYANNQLLSQPQYMTDHGTSVQYVQADAIYEPTYIPPTAGDTIVQQAPNIYYSIPNFAPNGGYEPPSVSAQPASFSAQATSFFSGTWGRIKSFFGW